MTRRLAVLRPEPGNAATVAAIERRGLAAISLPLFEIVALGWAPPDPANFDAILLTSANAVRHGGAGLAALHGLPAFAVGRATATAARASGFDVMTAGESNAAELIDTATRLGFSRLLHIGGRDTTIAAGGSVAASVPVYASEFRALGPDDIAVLAGAVVLLHSARAAARLAALVDRPGDTAIVAISALVAAAAGTGWAAVAVAAQPNGEALIDAAVRLAD